MKKTLLSKKYMETPCKHRFHVECLKSWMDQKLECPNCRQKIPPYWNNFNIKNLFIISFSFFSSFSLRHLSRNPRKSSPLISAKRIFIKFRPILRLLPNCRFLFQIHFRVLFRSLSSKHICFLIIAWKMAFSYNRSDTTFNTSRTETSLYLGRIITNKCNISVFYPLRQCSIFWCIYFISF